MTIRQLKYVVEVAGRGTLSDAAKALFVSQPSLTNAIKELEEEMQITIFHRTNKGVVVTNDGDEFLGYARQILEQSDMLEERYKKKDSRVKAFSVSTQHYSFAVNAFVDVINDYKSDKYEFTLRETQTHEIIEDVSRLKSEIGVLYLSNFNEAVITKMIRRHQLKFEELFVAIPHVFISKKHPLKDKDILTIEDLSSYPYLTFEQGDYNSFYYSEEVLSTFDIERNIKVRDRATLFNLLIGLNGYTVCSGVIDEELNGQDIIAKPIELDEVMRIGYIVRNDVSLSSFGNAYIEALKKHI